MSSEVVKDTREFIYRIDHKRRIDYVNDAWLDFATENGVSELRREDVIQKSIWSFIADRETEHIFQVILDKIRKDREPVQLPFRCDSPMRRRFMCMEISALTDSRIQFRSWILREEFRPPVSLLDPSIPRSEEVLAMCSWCKKVRVSGTDWQEVEEAVETLGLFDTAHLPKFTHTICQPCADIFWAKVEAGKH
jgi:hypothetical protein